MPGQYAEHRDLSLPTYWHSLKGGGHSGGSSRSCHCGVEEAVPAGETVTPLIGRDADLAALESALDSAKNGGGEVFLVAGDAGAGKTRLAREFIRRAEANGTVALWGGCSELDFSLPYLPFNEAIGAYVATADVACLRERLGSLADAVSAIVPGLSSGAPQRFDLTNGGARLQLFEAVIAVLRAVAHTAPSGVILVVDDVQWADASTRELLDFVARRARQLPLLLVMTYRSDEVSPSHSLRVILDGWRRAGLASTLPVRPLTAPEVRRLICARLGVDRVSHGFVDMLFARSGGVPLVVEQLLEHAINSGQMFERDGVWQYSALSKLDMPDSLAAGILRRLDRLESAHVRVVTAAAVLGRVFDPRLLPELTELPANTVSAALHASVNAQLLDTDTADPSRLCFRHPLIHEAVYKAIAVWDVTDLHARAADVLSRVLPPAPVIDRARHLLAAGRTSDAAPLCADAAEMAARSGAFAEAAALYEHALAGISDPGERGELLCEQGRMLSASGRPVTAVVPLKEGVELLQRVAHPSTPKVMLALGASHWFAGDHRASFEAFDAARVLLEKMPPSSDLASAYARVAMWHNSILDCKVGLEYADRALAMAEELDAELARAPALTYRGVALCELGQRDEGLALIDRGVAEAVRLVLPEERATGLALSAEQRAFAMRARELPQICEELRAVHTGPATEVYASLIEAIAVRFLGDAGETEMAARALVAGGEALGCGLLAFLGREILAGAWLEQGRLDDAAALMEDLGSREGMWQRSFGPNRVALAMARGDAELAANEARNLLDRLPAVVSDPFVASIAVPALLAAQDEDEAEHWVAAALGPDRHPMAVGAAADLAAFRGDLQTAVALYTEALDGAWGAGYRQLASQYRARLDAIVDGRSAGEPSEVRNSAGALLSPRELEILGLLARGKTDQQIADTVFITIRTVRSYLDRIRSKTGCRRRSELTLLAVELGLLEG